MTKDEVFVYRLAGGVPDQAEYIIGKRDDIEGEWLELRDVLRAICRLTPQRQMKQDDNGNFQETMTRVTSWEFYADEYFTEHVTGLNLANVILGRPVDPSEDLYKYYQEGIINYYEKKAIAKAENAAMKKVAEINKGRATKDKLKVKARVKPKKKKSRRASH